MPPSFLMLTGQNLVKAKMERNISLLTKNEIKAILAHLKCGVVLLIIIISLKFIIIIIKVHTMPPSFLMLTGKKLVKAKMERNI
jgi:hypothetical protein